MGSDSEAEKEKKKMLALAPIAKPLAGKKLCKRTLKLVRRGLFIHSHSQFAFLFLHLLRVNYILFFQLPNTNA